ncbi:succinylglutamate desuccinylase/aspartoacylase family protein [Leisingera sp. JC1]|uniref:succinylglutamate desuccinylase/aspartoacylase family protein n=1 Tax=Leisingera sp. JC1 TaxID=1855282 RepID=UPI000AE6B9F0|nr:hypothetical protein [Leisingera sp. JC1]
MRASHGGLLRAYKSEGDVVEEGDLLAIISDPFGEVVHEIAAPIPGVIVGRAVMPTVNEGDAVFHIARVNGEGDADETLGTLSNQLEDDPLFDEDEII